MFYLHAKSGGAYGTPQTNQFDGAILLNDDQLETFCAFKGFGDIVDGVFTGNQTLLDAWDAAQPEPDTTEPDALTQAQIALAGLAETESAHDIENKLALAELAETIGGTSNG